MKKIEPMKKMAAAKDPSASAVGGNAPNAKQAEPTMKSTALLDALEEQGIRLVLARVRTGLRGEMASSRIEERIGVEHIYLEVDDAVTANQPATTETSAHETSKGEITNGKDQLPG